MASDSISDLFGHQEWADSIHWRAFASHPGALEDDAIRQRLYHIQAVQRSFLSVWRGAPAWPEPFESYATTEALRDAARATHRDVAAFLEDVDANRLEENVIVPWFPKPQRPIRSPTPCARSRCTAMATAARTPFACASSAVRRR